MKKSKTQEAAEQKPAAQNEAAGGEDAQEPARGAVRPLESGRGQGRIAAMRFLFEQEFQPQRELGPAMERHFLVNRVRDGIAGYARTLIENVLTQRERIDGLISESLKNWAFGRLNLVDKTVLRLGVCELLFMPEIPPRVTINEMVEMAKLYSTEDSAAFTNGILDAICRKSCKDKDIG